LAHGTRAEDAVQALYPGSGQASIEGAAIVKSGMTSAWTIE